MRTRNRIIRILFLTLSMIVLLAMIDSVSAAEPTVSLGTAESFAVLAGSTITNTGSTTIEGSSGGNIGVSPGASVTGFPPGTVTDGTIYTADSTALQAQVDLVTAYNDVTSREVTMDLTGQDLGGLTLTTGVYSFSSSAQLTGTLTLDAQNDPEAVFIFQIGSTLTTAPSSVVSLINEARFCRVFWQVGSSATLGTSTRLAGHIFAFTSITAETGATMQGQLLALNGAVTLDSNTINNGICDSASAPAPSEETPAPTPSEEAPAPTPDIEAPTPTPIEVPVPVLPVDAPNPIAANDTATPIATTDNQELPNTGEPDNNSIYVIILISLAAFLAFFAWRRKDTMNKG